MYFLIFNVSFCDMKLIIKKLCFICRFDIGSPTYLYARNLEFYLRPIFIGLFENADNLRITSQLIYSIIPC